MNFRRNHPNEQPEINLVPLIDVLLVILIFLAASTSFTRLNQFKVALPEARADAVDNHALNIAISQDGLYALNGHMVPNGDLADITSALRNAIDNQDKKDPALVINADAQSSHESVVRVMQAARQAGISRVNFATQTPH